MLQMKNKSKYLIFLIKIKAISQDLILKEIIQKYSLILNIIRFLIY